MNDQASEEPTDEGGIWLIGINPDESLPEDGGVWKDYDKGGDFFIPQPSIFTSILKDDEYRIDLTQYAKPGEDKISDCRLSNSLDTGGHFFNLMKTVYEDQVYTLALCGSLHIKDIENDKDHYSLSVPGHIIDLIDAATKSKEDNDRLSDKYEFKENPFFEWINESGDPVTGILEEISLDPKVEIAKLIATLKS